MSLVSCCTFAAIIHLTMQLLIDLGNTKTKLAIFKENRQIHFHLVDRLTVPVLDVIFDEHPNLRSSILSSVAPYSKEIDLLLSSRTNYFCLSHQTPLPFTLAYETPQTLGKDRIAAVAGGVSLFPNTNLLVIDAGTSITYDLITAEGAYLGGAISPGIDMRFKALNTFTDKLPLLQHEPEINVDLIGNTTNTCIQSGVKNGVLAELEGIINRYQLQFPKLKVVVSGGDYKYFEKYIKSDIFATPNIVIQGLKKILDFNENK